MARVQITFVKLAVWKSVGADEANEKIPIKNEPVAWTLSNSRSVELVKSASGDRTGDDGAVTIEGFDCENNETLKFHYKLLDTEETLEFKCSTATLEKSFPEYCFHIDFIDAAGDRQEPVRNEAVNWKVGALTGAGQTGDAGRFIVKRLEKTVVAGKPTLEYEIRGQKSSVGLNFARERGQNDTEVYYYYYFNEKQYLSANVKIEHTGTPELIAGLDGQAIVWEIFKSPRTNGDAPVQNGSSNFKKTKERSGVLTLDGVKILQGEKFVVVYTINGENKSLDLSRRNNTGIIITLPPQRLTLPHIKIKFMQDRAGKAPVTNTPIEWLTAVTGNPGTDAAGLVEIKDMNISGVLQLKYKYKDKERVINVQHNDKSRQAEPLEIDEYLDGGPLRIDFKHGQKPVSNQEIIWTLSADAEGKSPILQSKTGDKTDGGGSLKIDEVMLREDEQLYLKYQILGVERVIKVNHTDASKGGQPLVITQYLTGVPITVAFINAVDKTTPIKNTPLSWELIVTDKVDEIEQVVEIKDSKTDEHGQVKFEDILIENLNEVKIKFTKVLGNNKEAVFIKERLEKLVANGCREALEEKIFIHEPFKYDDENDISEWDWIIWETEGNPGPQFSRGGRSRNLGLYRLNYHKLRKAEGAKWQDPYPDALGGGWVKVAVLDAENYSEHEALINTFLPCFSIDGRKIKEPKEWEAPVIKASTHRENLTGTDPDTINVAPPFIIMPFNYDDNGSKSKAIGTNLTAGIFPDVDAERLDQELKRWSTASRSTIAAFPPVPDKNFYLTPHREKPKEWSLRPPTELNWTDQIDGPKNGQALRRFQKESGNAAAKYYSVKTGVQFVSRADQSDHKKDLLEENSIHAMNRSNLIKATINRLTLGRFEARYQIEVLCILVKKDQKFDGIQIREISDAAIDDIWFPALTIPTHGKAFVDHWAPGQNWISFWRDNFAIPMGRAKGEMLLYFGMQHMTSNAQNFLCAFDRNDKNGKLKHLILRDIGDTLYNDHLFKELNEIDPLYKKEWEHEDGDKEFGVTLKSALGSYQMPLMTRIGGSIVFFFGPFSDFGDIGNDPDRARILSNWCIEHNYAFLNYMKEKLGYTENWKVGDGAAPTGDFPQRLRKHAELAKENVDHYPKLVKEVFALDTAARWRLISQIETECYRTTDVKTAKQLVNAHEMLICAEVQLYIQDAKGAEALRKLHAQGPPPAAPKPRLTREKYSRLHSGMSYENVVRLFGFEGTNISPQSGPPDVSVFQWRDDARRIDVIFNAESLHNRSQENLLSWD
ncbi:MAG TPA: hypothetical protein VIL74_01730 [Pyrinomonadaceae bacterium]|jgi:hypothetical protein